MDIFYAQNFELRMKKRFYNVNRKSKAFSCHSSRMENRNELKNKAQRCPLHVKTSQHIPTHDLIMCLVMLCTKR